MDNIRDYFKVGDKVKILYRNSNYGRIGIIEYEAQCERVKVQFSEKSWDFSVFSVISSLELVLELSREELISGYEI